MIHKTCIQRFRVGLSRLRYTFFWCNCAFSTIWNGHFESHSYVSPLLSGGDICQISMWSQTNDQCLIFLNKMGWLTNRTKPHPQMRLTISEVCCLGCRWRHSYAGSIWSSSSSSSSISCSSSGFRFAWSWCFCRCSISSSVWTRLCFVRRFWNHTLTCKKKASSWALLVQASGKENIKVPHHYPFLMGSCMWPDLQNFI